jgi:hypothetical protein
MARCRTTLEPKAPSKQQFPHWELDEDDFTVKDVIDFSPEPTSRSVRHAFTAFGFAVRRFTKCRDMTATSCASRAQVPKPQGGFGTRGFNSRRNKSAIVRSLCFILWLESSGVSVL